MKRLSAFALLGLGIPALAHAAVSEFDPALNGLRMAPDAVLKLDFENADQLVGAEIVTWGESQSYYPKLDRKPITSAADVSGMITEAVDAIESVHALRMGDGQGLLIKDDKVFSQLKDGRFSATLWVRADGTGPIVQAVYDATGADNVYSGKNQYALVRAIRTGRETTDGWAEYSTGTLDGSVWNVPIRALVVLPSSSAPKGSSFVIDALEIRKENGAPTAPLACTQANVDQVCGSEGDCIFGHCVSSTVTWGANPSAAHRSQIAERWVQYGTRFIGDRNSAHKGSTIFGPEARKLADTAPSSRQFYGGLNRLVNLLRDNHTSFGSPAYTQFNPQVLGGSSSIMGACFGVVEKDIMSDAGGLGFAVFRAVDDPQTGKQLKRGDVLVSIDGVDPKAWVDANWPRFATTLPNDPRADWGGVAGDLSSLITQRASTVEIERCADATSCGPNARQKITIDIATTIYNLVTKPTGGQSERIGCSQRFSEAVEIKGDSNGEDVVSTEKGSRGETRVQFDGFVGQGGWEASMTDVFSSGATHVLMDARMGHGGYYTTVEHLFHLLRGTSEPMGVFSVGRGTYDMKDPNWLLSKYSGCADSLTTESSGGGDFWTCYANNANGFFSMQEAPPGAATKIAWLNTRDVSANDFMPRLLKGRSNFKIFAPHPTSGAFGAVLSIPSVASGWSGSSIQIQDARFAPSIEDMESARWESGNGVEPDVVVAQKLSDAILGVDTILEAASAWLGE